MTISKRSMGFTLIELMIVVAILAIVTTIGVPSFNTLIKDNRLTAAANDLVGALQFARAEAVRRGRTIQVGSLDGGVANGLRVWFDENGNGELNEGEELRIVRLATASGLKVSGEVDGSSVAVLNIGYSPRGAVKGGSMRITLCDDRSGNHGKQLSLLASGLLRSSSGIACSN
ncbi:hypothetical protein Maes01_01624 [Microbulbifer aestuariivivens]|uniref:Type II secretion system protein H n=1 Tax=Microbulbifer aestuariivivens TaxID=1908308 RepID=A0ABP9WPD9_9GAMM